MPKGKTGYIWGRRISGDIVQGIDPVTSKLGRLYAPATELAGGIDQDFLAVSATQNYTLGSRMVADESVLRYCLNGAAPLAAGAVIQSPLPDALQLALALAPSTLVGAKSFQLTSGGTVVAHAYAGGYLACDGGALGTGIRLRIADNTGCTGVGVFTVTTIDAAPVVFTAATHTFQLAASPYSLVIVTPGAASPPTAQVLGVAPMIVPASNYFWLITRGPAIVKNTTGTPLSGGMAYASLTASGTMDYAIADDHTTTPIGRVIRTCVNTAWTLVDLNLD